MHKELRNGIIASFRVAMNGHHASGSALERVRAMVAHEEAVADLVKGASELEDVNIDMASDETLVFDVYEGAPSHTVTTLEALFAKCKVPYIAIQ